MSDTNRRTILAVDPGGRRFGVAIADLETRFARPLEVIDSQETDPVERVAQLADEHDAVEVIVGKPLGLDGREGPAVAALRGFITELVGKGLTVTEHDERLTTVIAERGMREAGANAATRKGMRDAMAAKVLLQCYLDVQR